MIKSQCAKGAYKTVGSRSLTLSIFAICEASVWLTVHVADVGQCQCKITAVVFSD